MARGRSTSARSTPMCARAATARWARSGWRCCRLPRPPSRACALPRRPDLAHLPASLATAWDRASPRERVLVRWMTVVVILAVLYAIAWQPLRMDIARTRDALDRERAAYAALRTYAEPLTAQAASSAPSAEPLAAVTRALDVRNLRASASQLEAREGRVMLLL